MLYVINDEDEILDTVWDEEHWEKTSRRADLRTASAFVLAYAIASGLGSFLILPQQWWLSVSVVLILMYVGLLALFGA